MFVAFSIGIPGSGKSTMMQPLAALYNAQYFSPDKIRERLTGNELDQTVNDLVWKELYVQVKCAMELKQSVVVDATFTNAHQRLDFVTFVSSYTRNIHGFWFNTPLEVCLARNDGRSRVVPHYAIQRLQASLEKSPPIFDRVPYNIHQVSYIHNHYFID